MIFFTRERPIPNPPLNLTLDALLNGINMLFISDMGIPTPLSEIMILILLSVIKNSMITSSFENLQAFSIRFLIAIESNPELPSIIKSVSFSGY